MSRSPHAARGDAEATSPAARTSRTALSDPDSMSPRQRRRRAITLLLLTLVIPGSAQLTAGSKRLGRAGVRIWLCLLIAGALLGLLVLVRRSLALSLFTQAWFLLLVNVALVAGAIFWAVLFFDAWRLSHLRLTPPGTRRLVSAMTAVLVLLTSGSMLYAAKQVSTGRDVLASVFGGNQAKGALNGRYNVLLLGGDSGKGRGGTRPDSINLLSVDADTGKSVMFGFARDTENIKFRDGSVMKRLMPGGWDCGDQCLLNGLYQWGSEHTKQFPPGTKDPGIVATREAVEALSGIDIQYYVLIDLKGFQRLVDAVGGLDINVKTKTPIGGGTSPIFGYIQPGERHLDGNLALWYARSREGSNNYERMARQRCVMTAMLQQLNPQTVLLKFQDLAQASGSVIHTDLPQSQLGQFGDLAIKARAQKIKSVNFVPPLIKPWDYDPAVVTSTVARSIKASEAEPVRTSTPTTAAKPKAATNPSTKPGSTTPSGGADESDLGSVCSS